MGYKKMGKTKILACRTLEDEILSLVSEEIDCEFLDYGLHNTPDKLRSELQQRVDQATDYDTLLFGYGLCSNGVAGLRSDKHTFVIPRVHDCISLLLGSRQEYDQEFAKAPATYYLSRGWIKQEGDPLSSYRKNLAKYGEENARWLVSEEYKNYQRVVFIETVGDNREYITYSQGVADFLGVRHEVVTGSLKYFEKLINGQWADEFLIIPPGHKVTLTPFL